MDLVFIFNEMAGFSGYDLLAATMFIAATVYAVFGEIKIMESKV